MLQNIAQSFVFLWSEIVDWEEAGCITKQAACAAVWASDSLSCQKEEREQEAFCKTRVEAEACFFSPAGIKWVRFFSHSGHWPVRDLLANWSPESSSLGQHQTFYSKDHDIFWAFASCLKASQFNECLWSAPWDGPYFCGFKQSQQEISPFQGEAQGAEARLVLFSFPHQIETSLPDPLSGGSPCAETTDITSFLIYIFLHFFFNS